LKLKRDELLSSLAIKFNLRRYSKDVDVLVKFFFNRLTKTDDTDIEKWCLVAGAYTRSLFSST
jgi:hypothetical protein